MTWAAQKNILAEFDILYYKKKAFYSHVGLIFNQYIFSIKNLLIDSDSKMWIESSILK